MKIRSRYINLDSRPDRNESFQKVFSFVNMFQCERFSAIQPSQADLSKHLSRRAFLELEDRKYHHQHTGRGSLGCYLSHLELWKDFLQSEDEFLLVFEDDIDATNPMKTASNIERGLQSLLEKRDWDIGLLGWQMWTEKESVFRTMGLFYGTQAYIVTRKAAEFFVRDALPSEMQVDTYMNLVLKKESLRLAKVPEALKVQQSKVFRTDIQSLCIFCEPYYVYGAFALLFVLLFLTILFLWH